MNSTFLGCATGTTPVPQKVPGVPGALCKTPVARRPVPHVASLPLLLFCTLHNAVYVFQLLLFFSACKRNLPQEKQQNLNKSAQEAAAAPTPTSTPSPSPSPSSWSSSAPSPSCTTSLRPPPASPDHVRPAEPERLPQDPSGPPRRRQAQLGRGLQRGPGLPGRVGALGIIWCLRPWPFSRPTSSIPTSGGVNTRKSSLASASDGKAGRDFRVASPPGLRSGTLSFNLIDCIYVSNPFVYLNMPA